jgi:hypothetical protein
MSFNKIPHQEKLCPLLVKHTPGPWYPGKLGGTVCAVRSPRASSTMQDGEVRAYGGYLICESSGSSGDVAVMSAAPDMYELLQKLHDWLAVNATGKQAFMFQVEIQELFLEIWRMGDRDL